MSEVIESLEIFGFRALSRLVIPSLGKVNLITGKNNSGKSTLLEAIRILTGGGSLKILSDILRYRDELGTSSDVDRPWHPTDLAPICNLFTGFPQLVEQASGFGISAAGTLPNQLRRISGRIGWFVRRVDEAGEGVSYEPVGSDLFGEVDAFPAVEFELAGRKRVFPIDRLGRRSSTRMEETSSMPCVYLDPFSSRSTSQMAALWDAIALTDVEPEIVKALQIVSSDIQAVSLVGTRERTVIAKSSKHKMPIPLRTFGDGVNRLFGIVLSLCSAKGGILLVDEIENGLHYSAQVEIWRTIFKLSEALNVQVFASSHSWDCVQAFQTASAESPQNGMLVRLSRTEDHIFATTFTENELAIATRDQIEVR